MRGVPKRTLHTLQRHRQKQITHAFDFGTFEIATECRILSQQLEPVPILLLFWFCNNKKCACMTLFLDVVNGHVQCAVCIRKLCWLFFSVRLFVLGETKLNKGEEGGRKGETKRRKRHDENENEHVCCSNACIVSIVKKKFHLESRERMKKTEEENTYKNNDE
jgi:hypothetical protein